MTGLTVVVGATGKVGREVVAGLSARGEAVRAASRDPARARRGLAAGVEVAAFDYDRPETFARALDGARRLFLSVRPGDEEADRTAIPLVELAVRQGVRHVVTLTAMGVERVEGNALRTIERRVESSGMTWTHLRPNFFMQVFAVPPLADQLRGACSLRVSAGDARLSFVDVRDVGAVAVSALLDARHSGRAYTLTGGEAIDHASVAAAISCATGRRVGYVPIGEEEARSAMSASLPPARVERLIGFYRLVRAGACAPVSPDVASVLRRPPIRFEEFARDHAAVWARCPVTPECVVGTGPLGRAASQLP